MNINEIRFEKNEVIAFADQFSKAVRFAIICAWDNSYNDPSKKATDALASWMNCLRVKYK